MPTISEALSLAVEHHQAGRLAEAEPLYRQVLAAEPNRPGVWRLLGLLAHQTGRHEMALQYIGRAVQLQPDDATAHVDWGLVYHRLGRLGQAVAGYRRALELRPDYPEALSNLAHALTAQGKLEEAVACGRRALELRPDYAEAYNNLGNALRDQQRLDEAAACYRRALKLRPDLAQTHRNLGIVLADQGQPEAALASYRRALELQPDDVEAHLGMALVMLVTGDFQQGWAEYQWRWRRQDNPPRSLQQPLWRGEPLGGRTCLLHAEQALGDTIEFVRYARLLKRQGARVVFECPAPLLRLLVGCPGIDRLVQQGDELPAFDVHAPLLSLPGILGTRVATIPGEVPYLFAEPELVGRWRDKMSRLDGFKIGINWRTRPGSGDWMRRTIAAQHFQSVAAVPGVKLVCLQKGVGPAEENAILPRLGLWDPGPDFDGAAAFVDTAAVMAHLDLVLTADTAVAHLAGALGVPVWVALPTPPDWRWLLERHDCPWYPSMRLFRQKRPGDWAGVFAEITAALCERLAGR